MYIIQVSYYCFSHTFTGFNFITSRDIWSDLDFSWTNVICLTKEPLSKWEESQCYVVLICHIPLQNNFPILFLSSTFHCNLNIETSYSYLLLTVKPFTGTSPRYYLNSLNLIVKWCSLTLLRIKLPLWTIRWQKCQRSKILVIHVSLGHGDKSYCADVRKSKQRNFCE
jgi:hypothetical protein